jgi:ABC-type nitrate/sulfonate/bicarbonate transport system substrate-binding protein
MASDHPDAPKQFGIRLSNEVMELVSAIQETRKRHSQSITLAAVVEDAIKAYYDLLVERGQINDKE